MKNYILTLTLFSFLYLPGIAQQLKKEKLDTLLLSLEENQKFMGSVSVAKNGKVIYSRAVGFQDIDINKKATLNTIYKVGSISKMYTATLVLRAVEEGKLLLDTKLAEFFPSIPNSEFISIEQMMGHRSGIFSVTSQRNYSDWKEAEITRAEMITKTSESKPAFEPGTNVKYSNSNYILLSYILEEVYNKTYGEILEKEIIRPLKLKNTYPDGNYSLSQQESHSYRFLGDWEKMPQTHPMVSMGAGFIKSTPTELIRFQEALLGGKLIRKESLAKMMSFENGMGYGMFEFNYSGRKSYGHTGDIDGFVSFVAHQPEDRITIVITSNGMNFSNSEIVQQIFNTLYEHNASLPLLFKLEIEDSELDKLSGTYSSAQAPIKIVVSHKNGYLIAQASGQDPFLLHAESQTVFKHLQAGIVLEFGHNSSEVILKQGSKEMKFTRE
ncbi:serine hydrolase domain-containing protein [Aquiflexum sp.]|uniref:serine hydrolase domain-containing protein n=1 Tax=Aquiflexum sp. TaxID=1872584 RepID=UPI0035937915